MSNKHTNLQVLKKKNHCDANLRFRQILFSESISFACTFPHEPLQSAITSWQYVLMTVIMAMNIGENHRQKKKKTAKYWHSELMSFKLDHITEMTDTNRN